MSNLMKLKFSLLFLNIFFALSQSEVVVIIPSYNNAKWYRGNLDSLFQQDYKKWRAIYIDDCSSDRTGQLVETYIQQKGFSHRINVIKNKTRKKALANIVDAIKLCKHNELIVLLDGDDRLAHAGVLSFIDTFYSNNDVWLTYGNFQWRSSKTTWSHVRAYSPSTILHNEFRDVDIVPSHLRTFYAGLFKKIKEADLKIDNDYFDMAWDLAIMLPMLEMAGKHFRFIPNILYDYNDQNSISDFRVDVTRQLRLNKYIRTLPRYTPLTDRPF